MSEELSPEQERSENTAQKIKNLSRRSVFKITAAAIASAIPLLKAESAQARPIDDEHEEILREKQRKIKLIEEDFDLPFSLSRNIYEAAEGYKERHGGKGLDAKYLAAVARWEHRGTNKKEYEQALKDTFLPSTTGDYGPFQINKRWFKDIVIIGMEQCILSQLKKSE